VFTSVNPDGSSESPEFLASSAGAVVRRRRLLRGCFWAGATALAAGGLASALELVSSRMPEPPDRNKYTVLPSDVPKPGGDPYHHMDGRFWLVNLKPGEGMPEYLPVADPASALGEPSRKGGLLALSQKCTFHGCTVPWRPYTSFGSITGWFRCPCCGAIYTKAGLRVFGPAPRPLDTLQILEVSRAGVSVNLTLRQPGSIDNAQRTVPAGPFG